MAIKSYAMCPCCGRSILVSDAVGNQRSLFDREEAAVENGGDVWELVTTSAGRGGIQHERGDAEPSVIERVRDELRRRCRAFLDRFGE